jgi:hypothetical protein
MFFIPPPKSPTPEKQQDSLETRSERAAHAWAASIFGTLAVFVGGGAVYMAEHGDTVNAVLYGAVALGGAGIAGREWQHIYDKQPGE